MLKGLHTALFRLAAFTDFKLSLPCSHFMGSGRQEVAKRIWHKLPAFFICLFNRCFPGYYLLKIIFNGFINL